MHLRELFSTLPSNIIRCFSPFNLVLQLAAVILTWLIVASGLDWAYFEYFNHTVLYVPLFSAGVIGFFLPLILPVALVIYGIRKKQKRSVVLGYAIAQAQLIALLITSFYKVFTGRSHPPIFPSGVVADTSRIFQFGFFHGGAFWGWPSSHCAVAFAMATLVFLVYRRKPVWGYAAIIYALFIAFGVSATAHWFSDAVAGSIIGVIAGAAVARSVKMSIKVLM